MTKANIHLSTPITNELLVNNGFTDFGNYCSIVVRDDSKDIQWKAKYAHISGRISIVNNVTDEKISNVRCFTVSELQRIFEILEIDKKIKL